MGDLVKLRDDELPDGVVPVGHVLENELNALWSAVQDAKVNRQTAAEKPRRDDPVRFHVGVRADFPAYVAATLDAEPKNEKHSEMISAVREWSDGRGPLWLTIGGTRGIGKTWLACAAANHMARAGRSVTIMKFSDAIRMVQKADRSGDFRGIGGAVAHVLGRCTILDDVGVSSKTAYAGDMIEEIFDWSYRQRTRLLMTTNLDGRALAEYLDARATDRARECGTFIWGEWPSLRGRS